MITNKNIKFLERFSPGKLPDQIEREMYESYKHDPRTVDVYLNSKWATYEGAQSVKNNPDISYKYYDSRFVTDSEMNDGLHANTSNSVKKSILSNPKLKDYHIDVALNFTDSILRTYAAKHPNATDSQIYRALNDVPSVRASAVLNPSAKIYHLDKAIDDVDPSVRMNVLMNPNHTLQHIDKALNDDNYIVRHAAILSDKITKRQMQSAIDSGIVSSEFVSAINPKKFKEYFSTGY